MVIDYRVIPHKEQRYPTVGDYWLEGETLQLRVSKMSDARYEWLVALHELIEFSTCQLMGVELKAIDAFDTEYEDCSKNKRALPCGCKIPDIHDEPGDDPHAPYYRQHQIATIAERTIAFLLGVNWATYDVEVELL